jgi:hypothetical protein
MHVYTGSWGEAPRIDSPDTSYRTVVIFAPCRFSPRETVPGTYPIGNVVRCDTGLHVGMKNATPVVNETPIPRRNCETQFVRLIYVLTFTQFHIREATLKPVLFPETSLRRVIIG